MGAVNLVVVEMRRALHRWVVRVLIGLALVGILIVGLIAYVESAGKNLAELRVHGSHAAVMADWWIPGGGDSILMIAAIPLLIGGLLGGASVAGAEWRAGTVSTALTWEPRRLRLHAARTLACFLLAVVIAFVLEALFLGATLPAVLTHGSTVGVDGAWWLDLLGAMSRIALLSGAAAVLGVSLATLGRGTTFALGASFAWMAVVEGLIRQIKPALQDLLIGDNLAIVLTWAQLDGAGFTKPAPLAAVTLVVYFGVLATVATGAFVRRDVAGSG